MWYRLKNSLQAATASLAIVFSLMAAGHLPAESSGPEVQAQRTLTGMTPQAEQLLIAIAAKIAATAIDEALAEQPTAMNQAEVEVEVEATPAEPPSNRRSRAGLNQRMPFFSFAVRPARSQGS